MVADAGAGTEEVDHAVLRAVVLLDDDGFGGAFCLVAFEWGEGERGRSASAGRSDA